MDVGLWTGFVLATLVLAVVPGPGVAAVVGLALGGGRRVALAGVSGMALGNTIANSLSLAGAGALLATSAMAFTALKWAGALYLIAMGVLAIRRAGRVDAAGAPAAATSPRAAFVTTFAIGVFHPKTILFFMAFAPQFIRAHKPFLPQAASLVATFIAITATTDTLYALAASRAASALRSPGARLWGGRAGGGALILAGAATAALRR